MLIARGVNVFPSQIEAVTIDQGDGANNYQSTVSRENNRDKLLAKVEMTLETFSDGVVDISNLERRPVAGVADNARYQSRGPCRGTALYCEKRRQGCAVTDKRNI